jgi:hypothetical protein
VAYATREFGFPLHAKPDELVDVVTTTKRLAP